MKAFKIDDKHEILCECITTRYGFKHEAKLYRTGLSGTTTMIESVKVCCYNRTWESFEYESVILKLLDKAKIMPKDQVTEFMECCRKCNLEEINRQFGFIAGIAKLGEIMCDSQKEKNDWKARMIKAGLENQGLIMPDDWDKLDENEKEKRLNGVISELENKS